MCISSPLERRWNVSPEEDRPDYPTPDRHPDPLPPDWASSGCPRSSLSCPRPGDCVYVLVSIGKGGRCINYILTTINISSSISSTYKCDQQSVIIFIFPPTVLPWLLHPPGRGDGHDGSPKLCPQLPPLLPHVQAVQVRSPNISYHLSLWCLLNLVCCSLI